jgi:hypothetical protein
MPLRHPDLRDLPHRTRRAALLGLLALVLAVAAVLAIRRSPPWLHPWPDDRSRRRPESVALLGTFPDVLVETSGLAVSRSQPGILWTHNDSGGGARVYATDEAANVKGVWEVVGAGSVDWEDIDLASCPLDPTQDCLFVGDIGDNDREREVLSVYVFPEPDAAAGGGETATRRLRYRYPDEPHDAEALAVAPGGTLVIVTKGRTGSALLFVLDPGAVREAILSDTVITLRPGRPLPVVPDFLLGRQITGAGFDRAGSVLAVRSYTEAYFFRWPVDAAWTEAAPRCVLAGVDRIGEGVAFAGDGSLLLTAEGRPPTLNRIRCPGLP